MVAPLLGSCGDFDFAQTEKRHGRSGNERMPKMTVEKKKVWKEGRRLLPFLRADDDDEEERINVYEETRKR